MVSSDFPYEASFLSAFSLSVGMAIGQREILDEWKRRIEAWNLAAGMGSSDRAKALLDLLNPPEGKPARASVSEYSGQYRDYIYGDALVVSGDRGFIVEFKRTLDDWRSEVDPKHKPHKIRVLELVTGRTFEDGVWSAYPDPSSQWYEISGNVHWFSYGTKPDSTDVMGLEIELGLRFTEYRNLTEGRTALSRNTKGLSGFVNAVAGGEIGASLPVLGSYLTAIRRAALEKSDSDNDADEANGILVYFDAQRRSRLLWFRSLAELQRILESLGWKPPSETVEAESQHQSTARRKLR